VTPDRWSELTTFFGPGGAYGNCWCTYFRQPTREFEAGCRDRGRGNRAVLERLTAEGRVPGLLARSPAGPVGWVSVAPRTEFGRVLRSPQLRPRPPGDDPADPDIWSVVCFWVPRAARGAGVAGRLLAGAVEWAAGNGARIIEGYPVDPGRGRAQPAAIYTGTLSLFAAAGFVEHRRPGGARVVVRRPVAASATG
jgi:GNAT superfamily N-acetyltransferase